MTFMLSKSAPGKKRRAITASLATVPGKDVKIRFYPGEILAGHPEFTFNVNTASTVIGLTAKLQAERQVIFSS